MPGPKSTRRDASYEVVGYNHNVANGFLSLRPAIFAAGGGAFRCRSLKYRAF
jgi:xylan 1,4-beta-xylosidase